MQRQKERLFELVDNLDRITNIGKSQQDDNDEENIDIALNNENSQVDNRREQRLEEVALYRKRLMRWKNIGVWTTNLSVGIVICMEFLLAKGW